MKRIYFTDRNEDRQLYSEEEAISECEKLLQTLNIREEYKNDFIYIEIEKEHEKFIHAEFRSDGIVEIVENIFNAHEIALHSFEHSVLLAKSLISGNGVSIYDVDKIVRNINPKNRFIFESNFKFKDKKTKNIEKIVFSVPILIIWFFPFGLFGGKNMFYFPIWFDHTKDFFAHLVGYLVFDLMSMCIFSILFIYIFLFFGGISVIFTNKIADSFKKFTSKD